ncbi:unnamed protein product [Closterium sp. NIES-54]
MVPPPAAAALGAAATRVRYPALPYPALVPPCPECCYAATAACATAATSCHCLPWPLPLSYVSGSQLPGGGASRARAGGAGAGSPCTRRQEPLSSQQLRKRAVRWGSPGGGAWCATTGCPYESTPTGSAAGRRGGSGGGQQRQQRPPETLSPQQLHEWAVQWGSPGGGAWGTSAGGGEASGGVEAASLGAVDSASTGAEPEEALHTFTLDSGASRCFFCDSTTVKPLTFPVPVTLADPSGGPVLAHGANVLPCPAAPSCLLTGLHLPSFAKNLVATSVLQDQWVSVTQPGGELVATCTDSCTGEHLATFTRRPGSGLYTLTTESTLVVESGQVAASIEVASSCSCRLLMHQTLLWHHRLGHPSLRRLHDMHSRLLVSSLPRSLPPLPRSLAPPCLPCVEGRQRATPHSSSFPPTTAPLQTLHMDVWGPACVTGQGGECYFLLVVNNYTRYTTVFPLQSNADDLPVLRLHSDRGGEFCSHLLEDFCGAEGIVRSYSLPASPQQNGIAECRIGLVMEPRVSHPETSPTLRWTGEVGDASPFRVWGSLSLVRNLSAGKLSPRTLRCMFLGIPTDAPPWQFYHSGSCRVLSSRNVTFDESVCFYRHPHRSSPVDRPPLVEPLEVFSDTFGLAEGGYPTPAATVTPRRSARLAVPPGFPPRPSSPPLQHVAVDSGAAGGGTTGGASSGGAGYGGAECPLGTRGIGGTGTGGLAMSRQEALSPERLREWAVQWGSPGGGASRLRAGGAWSVGAVDASTAGAGGSATGGAGVARTGGTGARRRATLSPERLREWAVQWGNPGGGASRARSPRAGGTGGAAAVVAAAGCPGSRRQASLSPEQLRKWAVRWGSPGGGAGRAGAAGSGGASPGGSRGASPRGAGAGVPSTGGTGAAGTAGGDGGAGTGGTNGGAVGVLVVELDALVLGGAVATGAGGTGSGGAVATRAGGSRAHWAWGSCLEDRVHCEAEICAGAMAAQELRWLTYLLADLGEQPRSPPVLYVDNKTMIALCQNQRL